jgi:hypothetical protein
MTSSLSSLRLALRTDFASSLVVFLVALPLCVGVAVASGVPAELGLITGIVGGLVTGLLPGSSLQVSGPAAGLTVLVLTAVTEYGLPALGMIVLAAGLLQLALGALRLGRLFRAVSLSVVYGMLAGIGLVLITGQMYALGDRRAPGSGLSNVAGLPGLLTDVLGSGPALTAIGIGAGTVVIMTLWKKMPAKAQLLPGPLVAVGLTVLATVAFDLPVERVEVKRLTEAIQPLGLDGFSRLSDVGLLTTIVAFTLIASAESLFSAAAVDRLHDGPKTAYDKELMAQGAGNTVCGLLGALPMTAVIVRSAANVQAGVSAGPWRGVRRPHGLWVTQLVNSDRRSPVSPRRSSVRPRRPCLRRAGATPIWRGKVAHQQPRGRARRVARGGAVAVDPALLPLASACSGGEDDARPSAPAHPRVTATRKAAATPSRPPHPAPYQAARNGPSRCRSSTGAACAEQSQPKPSSASSCWRSPPC